MAWLQKIVIAAVTAIVSTLLLDQAHACRCAFREPCDHYDDADVVLRATALTRSDEATIDGNLYYKIQPVTIFKEEPDVHYENVITFRTSSSSASCGVVLELGSDYALGLRRDDDGVLSVTSCNLARPWVNLSDADQALLEAECESDIDMCEGACGEFQECLLYIEGSSEEYYCADVCDPSPCEADEVCTFNVVQCFRAPCPALAECTAH